MTDPKPVEGEKSIQQFNCDKHGPYEAEAVYMFDRYLHVMCPECSAIAAAENEENERLDRMHKRHRRIKTLKHQSGIPKRFAESSFEHFEADSDVKKRILATCKKYADSFEDRLSMGGGLVFCGKPGTGKTLLACAIANQIITDSLRVPVFTSVTKLARAVKDTYRKGSELTEQDVIDSFVNPDLLIIDEIGAQRGTETELLIMQEVIDERYQQVRSTILLSNLPEQELGQYIGERAIDRMYEGKGAVLAFTWESYRRKGKSRTFEQREPLDHHPRDLF